ncbi:WecB/TagA/CpsF family glycosyltransferase [Arthrobacter sp. LjRoot78]|uniref:WecB/TagA/CpsF family glycosyltransferase n=1 Tax=Arthrobacter sp. LjRoot78 TaxID=3342338 RepID=UPI003ED0EB7B
MDKSKFAGIPFCISTPVEAVKFIVDVVGRAGAGLDVHFLNAYSIALSESDADYRKCLLDSAYNFPDGKPISVLNRLRSGRLVQVRGPGFFESVMDFGREFRIRHYLLGSTPKTLEKLQTNLENRYPGIEIVGSFSPPFRQMSPAEQIDQDQQIKESGAQIVWVGLGTPKQDFEAARLAAAGLNAVAIGAAFDFSAGTKVEAPAWLSKVGLEWLFRFATEPKRLWRRYLVGNLVFLRAATRKGVI